MGRQMPCNHWLVRTGDEEVAERTKCKPGGSKERQGLDWQQVSANFTVTDMDVPSGRAAVTGDLDGFALR